MRVFRLLLLFLSVFLFNKVALAQTIESVCKGTNSLSSACEQACTISNSADALCNPIKAKITTAKNACGPGNESSAGCITACQGLSATSACITANTIMKDPCSAGNALSAGCQIACATTPGPQCTAINNILNTAKTACATNPLSPACNTACQAISATSFCAPIANAQNICSGNGSSDACKNALGQTPVPNAVCAPPNQLSSACQQSCGNSTGGLCNPVGTAVNTANTSCTKDPLSADCKNQCKALSTATSTCINSQNTQAICAPSSTSTACRAALGQPNASCADNPQSDACISSCKTNNADPKLCTPALTLNTDIDKACQTVVSDACKNACKGLTNIAACVNNNNINDICAKNPTTSTACRAAQGQPNASCADNPKSDACINSCKTNNADKALCTPALTLNTDIDKACQNVLSDACKNACKGLTNITACVNNNNINDICTKNPTTSTACLAAQGNPNAACADNPLSSACEFSCKTSNTKTGLCTDVTNKLDAVNKACASDPLSSACATACAAAPDTATCKAITNAQTECAKNNTSKACIAALGATPIPDAVCAPPNQKSAACQANCAPSGTSGTGLCAPVAGDTAAALAACKNDPLAAACTAACQSIKNVPICTQFLNTQAICKPDPTAPACLSALAAASGPDAVCKASPLSQECQAICTASGTKLNEAVCSQVKTKVDGATTACQGLAADGSAKASSKACEAACKDIHNTPICLQADAVREACKMGMKSHACLVALGAVDAVAAADACAADPKSTACKDSLIAACKNNPALPGCAAIIGACGTDPKDPKASSAACTGAIGTAAPGAGGLVGPAVGAASTATGLFPMWLEELLHVRHETEIEGAKEAHEAWKSVEDRCGVGVPPSCIADPADPAKGPNSTACKDDTKKVEEGTLTSGNAHRSLIFIATREETLKFLHKPTNSGDTITLEDRMQASMVNAHMYKEHNADGTEKALYSGEKPLDYQNRGELLVKHPLSVPINLAVWCIAVKAQELLPMFCSQAIKLFTLLLILEFTWMGVQYVIHFADIGQIIDGIVTKMHMWTFSGCVILTVYYGFSNSNWMYSVFSSMNQIGEDVVTVLVADMQTKPAGATGDTVFRDENGNEVKDELNPDGSVKKSGEEIWLSSKNIGAVEYAAAPKDKNPTPGEALSPGSYFAMCILVITSIWSKITVNFSLQSLLFIPIAIFVTPIILVSFLKMAADIALTMLEGYLAIGLLAILVAFSACRWGSEYFQKAILYCVMMGFKLICMYTVFIIGVRMMSYVSISTWFVKSTGDYIVCIMTLLSMVMLVSFIFQRLGAMAMALFGGSPLLSFGQLVKDSMDNASAGAMPFKALGKGAKYGGKLAKWSGKKLGINAKLGKAKNATKDWGRNKLNSARDKVGLPQKQAKPPKSPEEKKAAKKKEKEKKAEKDKVKNEVKEGLKGSLDDTPSGGNMLLPTVNPPGDD